MQQAQEKDALALDHELRKLKEEHQRASQRLSVAGMELERLRKENAPIARAEGPQHRSHCREGNAPHDAGAVLEDTRRSSSPNYRQQAQT